MGGERFSVISEGAPIPEEAVMLLSDERKKTGLLLMSLLVETPMDVYFLGGEGQNVLACDIVDNGENVGFLWGAQNAAS